VIESLTIGQTDIQNMMRLTIVVDGSKTAVEQVVKQLYKVIEVRKVSDLSDDQPVVRELALIKVSSKPNTRGEIMQLVDIYRARIVDVALGSVLIEVTGDPEKIDSIVGLLRGFGIKELVRTRVVAMVRGSSGKDTANPREVPAWA
jgi:acetolactate synthase-1/3 small subunit